jgi:hypothetical protein
MVPTTGSNQIPYSDNPYFKYVPSTGTLTANILVAGSIVNLNANGVGNIGSSTLWFSNIFARTFNGVSVTARYADLAEKYTADSTYEPGTVLIFGGNNEVTKSDTYMDTRVAGVVSTNPAYVMNQDCLGDHVAIVALQGKVPTKVIGPVGKGDILVTAPNGYATACASPVAGSLVGKSLENFTATIDNQTSVIYVVVGK